MDMEFHYHITYIRKALESWCPISGMRISCTNQIPFIISGRQQIEDQRSGDQNRDENVVGPR
jgi:hypothetical protein